MSRTRRNTINKIEQIENLLRELKLELDKGDQPTDKLKVGDKVRIKNPSRGQPKRGTIAKIHPTKRCTVVAVDAKNKEIKIIRLLKNLEKTTDDS